MLSNSYFQNKRPPSPAPCMSSGAEAQMRQGEDAFYYYTGLATLPFKRITPPSLLKPFNIKRDCPTLPLNSKRDKPPRPPRGREQKAEASVEALELHGARGGVGDEARETAEVGAAYEHDARGRRHAVAPGASGLLPIAARA